MSWTDERIETLRKLWLAGSSASQIAKQLSNGMTRNAVIGKVHRLGLSGRVKPLPDCKEILAEAKAPAVKFPNCSQHILMPRQPQPQQERSIASRPQMAPVSHGNTALAYDELEVIETGRAPCVQIALDDVVIPISQRVTIMELHESMCRWPLGDPAMQEFRFCGTRIAGREGSYCAHHARIAYQPHHERRRERRMQKVG